MNLSATGAGGWCSDGTARVMSWIESWAAGSTCGKTAGRGVDVYQGRKRSQRIEGAEKDGIKDINSARRSIAQEKVKGTI